MKTFLKPNARFKPIVTDEIILKLNLKGLLNLKCNFLLSSYVMELQINLQEITLIHGLMKWKILKVLVADLQQMSIATNGAPGCLSCLQSIESLQAFMQ